MPLKTRLNIDRYRLLGDPLGSIAKTCAMDDGAQLSVWTLLLGALITCSILGFCHRRSWQWRLLLLQGINVLRRT